MFVLFACVHWFPAYLIRSYQMTEGAAGALLGPVLGILGAASLFGGGYLTDVVARWDVRWRAWIPAIGALAGAPLLAAALYVENRSATLALFGLAYFAVMLQNAPITAMIQSLVPLRLRARATAVFLLMTTLTGFGTGPTVVGFLPRCTAQRSARSRCRLCLDVSYSAAPDFTCSAGAGRNAGVRGDSQRERVS